MINKELKELETEPDQVSSLPFKQAEVEFPEYENQINHHKTYYYKHLKSLKQKDVVISHPYDMSHKANLKNSFLNAKMKTKDRPYTMNKTIVTSR